MFKVCQKTHGKRKTESLVAVIFFFVSIFGFLMLVVSGHFISNFSRKSKWLQDALYLDDFLYNTNNRNLDF